VAAPFLENAIARWLDSLDAEDQLPFFVAARHCAANVRCRTLPLERYKYIDKLAYRTQILVSITFSYYAGRNGIVLRDERRSRSKCFSDCILKRLALERHLSYTGGPGSLSRPGPNKLLI
jgi:hypothetical protein